MEGRAAGRDGDGLDAPTDCDDSDPAIRPSAPDAYDDGIDQDCDGKDAENPDRDGDGAPRPLDCSDGTRPGAPDTPADGVDRDCNGADAARAAGASSSASA